MLITRTYAAGLRKQIRDDDALLVAVTNALLDAGADPEHEDNNGRTALRYYRHANVIIPQLLALFSGPRRGTRKSPRKRARVSYK